MTVEALNMQTVALEDLAPESPQLRVADRCDHGRCGAQAFVVTRHHLEGLISGRTFVDMTWCGHHFRENELELLQYAVIDARDSINQRPGGSA